MQAKVVSSDQHALDWVRENLAPIMSETGSGVVAFASRCGGPKVVGVYSLPNELMYSKGRAANSQSKLGHSIYVPDQEELGTRNDEGGTGRKVQNRRLRNSLQPVELDRCDVFLALNQNPRQRLDNENVVASLLSITKVHVAPAVLERGAAVVYTQLPYDRVITPLITTAKSAGCVWYGTSGLYNLAELILTIKAAYQLKLPAKFDNYRFAVQADAARADQEREGMRQFAQLIMDAVGMKSELTLGETSEMVLGDVLDMPVRQLAWEIQSATRHPCAFLRSPAGLAVFTNDIPVSLRGATLRQLHEKGWWAGGSLIYWAFYAQSKKTPFVAVVFDGSKGGIHLLAKPWMEERRLWVIPAGSYHITTESADLEQPWANVLGPWQLLEFAKSWGPEKTAQILTQLWGYARIPLAVEDIGRSDVVKVGLDGLEVERRTNS